MLTSQQKREVYALVLAAEWSGNSVAKEIHTSNEFAEPAEKIDAPPVIEAAIRLEAQLQAKNMTIVDIAINALDHENWLAWAGIQ